MAPSRMAVFLSIVLGIWAAMHLYVFWRMASIPWVASHASRKLLLASAIVLWSSYPLSRILDVWRLQFISWPLEYLGAFWIGVLFLLMASLLVVDVVTLGGLALPRIVPAVRGWAVVVALVLSSIGFVQAFRAPVVRSYEVRLAGLPRERDGLVLIEISDLHLGTLIGGNWLSGLTDRVNAMRPDIVCVVGDLVDGNVGRVQALRPVLQELRAPLGVWAVTGNHEYYAGLDRSLRLFEEAGFSVLRDAWAEVVPGLVLAGVDDLTARAQFGVEDRTVEKALTNRPPGATILLSHSPWEVEVAARAGVGLMLCGHTHNGQIWPFTYLVGLRYPLTGGRYQTGGMEVIVCRGTGTWGPRIRLWRPSEIVRVTLRASLQGTEATVPGAR
jgi:uncharacterized protein